MCVPWEPLYDPANLILDPNLGVPCSRVWGLWGQPSCCGRSWRPWPLRRSQKKNPKVCVRVGVSPRGFEPQIGPICPRMIFWVWWPSRGVLGLSLTQGLSVWCYCWASEVIWPRRWLKPLSPLSSMSRLKFRVSCPYSRPLNVRTLRTLIDPMDSKLSEGVTFNLKIKKWVIVGCGVEPVGLGGLLVS